MSSGRGRRVRPRLSQTGAKVWNVLGIIYMEDLEANGLTYGDLLSYCDSLHVRCAVSPIHNRDWFTADDVWSWCEQHIDPETGDLDVNYVDYAPYVGKPKKEHVHWLGMFNRGVTAAEVTEMFAGLMEIRSTVWERAQDPSSCIRYFAHMDSADKAQYSPYDIHGFGGIKLDALSMNDSKSRMAECTNIITTLIKSEGIMYFHRLVWMVQQFEDPEIEACLSGKFAYFNAIIRSRRDDYLDSREEKAMLRKMAKEEAARMIAERVASEE